MKYLYFSLPGEDPRPLVGSWEVGPENPTIPMQGQEPSKASGRTHSRPASPMFDLTLEIEKKEDLMVQANQNQNPQNPQNNPPQNQGRQRRGQQQGQGNQGQQGAAAQPKKSDITRLIGGLTNDVGVVRTGLAAVKTSADAAKTSADNALAAATAAQASADNARTDIGALNAAIANLTNGVNGRLDAQDTELTAIRRTVTATEAEASDAATAARAAQRSSEGHRAPIWAAAVLAGLALLGVIYALWDNNGTSGKVASIESGLANANTKLDGVLANQGRITSNQAVTDGKVDTALAELSGLKGAVGGLVTDVAAAKKSIGSIEQAQANQGRQLRGISAAVTKLEQSGGNGEKVVVIGPDGRTYAFGTP